jgi:hypothetical protein
MRWNETVFGTPVRGAPSAGGDFQFEGNVECCAIRAGLSAGDDFEFRV